MLAFAMRSSPRPRVPPRMRELRCSSFSRSLRFALTSVRARAGAPFVAPLFSWSYELLFPQPLCIHNDLRCPGGVPFGAAPAPEFSRPIGSSSVHSIGYALFGASKKVNLRHFNHFRTLSTNHPGWGYLTALDRRLFRRSRLRRRFATWTRAAHPTIIAVSSRFQVHG